MKWNPKPPSSVGETRNTKKFLFIPRTFKGERRWFEFAVIAERYQYYMYHTVGNSELRKGWEEIGFAE